MNCKYIKPWIGKCNIECDGDYCEEHSKEKCCICGKQAVKGCDNTQFMVCGEPLCDSSVCDTIHEIYSHGWKLDEFMNWTGRKHTDEEIIYINKVIAEKVAEYEKALAEFKKNRS